jgi:hypothetical protein
MTTLDLQGTELDENLVMALVAMLKNHNSLGEVRLELQLPGGKSVRDMPDRYKLSSQYDFYLE